jgi:hypothetical protein
MKTNGLSPQTRKKSDFSYPPKYDKVMHGEYPTQNKLLISNNVAEDDSLLRFIFA